MSTLSDPHPTPPKRRVIEPVVAPRGDPWLTCNQPGCHKVCADRHDLYLHKTSAHGLNVGPEQRSLIQSTLRQA